jgi:hypothetical protein
MQMEVSPKLAAAGVAVLVVVIALFLAFRPPQVKAADVNRSQDNGRRMMQPGPAGQPAGGPMAPGAPMMPGQPGSGGSMPRMGYPGR